MNKKFNSSVSITNRVLFIVLALILIGALFSGVYALKSSYSMASKIQNFQNRIAILQKQNKQFQSTINKLQQQVQNEDNTNNSLNLSTGAKGTLQYGTGNCMPCPCSGSDCSACPQKKYSYFNGDLYFVLRDKLDSLGKANLDNLIKASPKTSVNNGKYEIKLVPGEYVVLPNGVYQSGQNIIKVVAGKISTKDFKLFKCNTY